MRVIIDDGGRASAGYKGQANDCVCRAVAIATEQPYQEIYDRLEAMIQAKFGPTKRPPGVEALMHGGVMRAIGWVWVPTSNDRNDSKGTIAAIATSGSFFSSRLS